MGAWFEAQFRGLAGHGAAWLQALGLPVAIKVVQAGLGAPAAPTALYGVALVVAAFLPVRAGPPHEPAAQAFLARLKNYFLAGGIVAAAAVIFWDVPRVYGWALPVWMGLAEGGRGLARAWAWWKHAPRAEALRRNLDLAWSWNLEKRMDLALGEVALLAAVQWLGKNLWRGMDIPTWATGLAVAVWLALRAVWSPAEGKSWRVECARLAGLWLSVAVVFAGAWKLTGRELGAGHAVLSAYSIAGLALYRFSAVRAGGLGVAENLRRLTLGLAGLWLMHPFATRGLHGGGDALWYGTMLADMIAQLRAGVFPVFVGQSEFQFNGAIFPLRISPAFHYYGGTLDALTLHGLEPVALQNLLILLLGVGGVFCCYAALVALLAPAQRTAAAVLAWLYAACPGVMGLAYNTDLFMTWTTVPFVPLVLGGLARVLRGEEERGAWRRVAVGLGLIWWGHAPVALWTSAVAGGAVIFWLSVRRPRLARVAEAMGFGVVGALLAAYPLVSYLTAAGAVEAKAVPFHETDAGRVAEFIAEVFPAVWRPLSENGRSLGDFQLGYALWAVWLAAVWAGIKKRDRTIWFWGGVGAVLALLLTPVPWLNEQLWRLVPSVVRNATGNWAMNRLYLLLAAVAVVLAAELRRRPREAWPTTRWAPFLAVLALGWTGWEAEKFLHGSAVAHRAPESGPVMLRPENTLVTRNAYLVFPRRPAYYSEGVMDPLLENRLRARANPAEVTENLPAGSREIARGEFRITDDRDRDYLELDCAITLQPGRRCLLTFDFLNQEARGTLRLAGGTFFREYALPVFGETRAFGAGAGGARTLSLWTTESTAQQVKLFFITDVARRPVKSLLPFARVRGQEFSAGDLPVQVESWIPYRSRVRAEHEAWLETPRMWQRGYEAVVNGRPAAVQKSPEGLVMIPVPAGESRVELRFAAPWPLAGAFWVSILTLILVSAHAFWHAMRE